MFSFHKPKVYRSTQGCCICKAKSSSSRFTDSKKYETDFIECFQLKTPRKGEICNACVLLVKRFKRLPPGSDRNWGHVVDARVGPGLKSMTKFKKRKEEQMLQQQNGNGKAPVSVPSQNVKPSSSVSERFGKIFKKTKKKKILETENRDVSPSSDENSSPSSPSSIPTDSENVSMDLDDDLDNDNNRTNDRRYKKYQRKGYRPMKNRRHIVASIIDEECWMKVKTCCGFVYENKLFPAVLLDIDSISMCPLHKGVSDPTKQMVKTLIDTSQQIAQIDAFNTQVQEMYANNAAHKYYGYAPKSSILVRNDLRQINLINNTNMKNRHKLNQLLESNNQISTISYDYMRNLRAGKIAKLLMKPKSNVMKDIVDAANSGAAADELLNEVLGPKMNENSSDSGYDESNIQESNQKSMLAAKRIMQMHKGVKVNVVPEKIKLAMDLFELLGVNNYFVEREEKRLEIKLEICNDV
ncbi:SIN3-HDAC complex-associated factor, partial [Pseudolycoriella hygida]